MASSAQTHGYLFTDLVSERIATLVSAIAIRSGVHPSVLTLGSLAIGVGGGVAATLGADHHPLSAAVVVGAVLFQVAYVLDCADGQVARATATATLHGARLDILVDVVVQSSMLVAVATLVAHWSRPPTVVPVAFATSWFVNIVTFLTAKPHASQELSLVRSISLPAQLLKLGRDYGFVVLVLGVWAVVAPASLVVPVIALTVMNFLLLFAFIGHSAVASMRQRPTAGRPVVGGEGHGGGSPRSAP